MKYVLWILLILCVGCEARLHPEFPNGSTVQFKLGGPEMIVRCYNPDFNYLICVWIDSDNEYRQGKFPPEVLTRTDANEPKSPH